MKKIIILVRGIPGSGKTAHAQELVKEYGESVLLEPSQVKVLSADDYFNVQLGPHTFEYRFDWTKLPIAHNQCFVGYLKALKDDNIKVIIVDNRFIWLWEMQPYIQAGMCEGDLYIHEVRVTTIEELKRCVLGSVHNVPPDVIASMAMGFEPMDPTLYRVVTVPFRVDLDESTP
jgi:hypothetical protein